MPLFREVLGLGVRSVFCAAVVAAIPTNFSPARAQGKLDAQYVVTLAGLPIGKGRWTVDVAEDRYVAAASGATAGLMRLFASGDGTSSVQGAIIGGAPAPGNFVARITAGKKTEEFRITLADGTVKEVSITPLPPPNPERIPLTEAHRRGVIDPMTASLLRVPGNGNPVGPEACERTVSVFDGRMRYDVQLAFRRVEHISAEKGYAGPAAVCTVTFVPIAGHNPERAAVKYLVTLRDLEVWLAPIAGTRLVAPFRVAIPTPIGLGVMHATAFETVARAAQPTATSAKVR